MNGATLRLGAGAAWIPLVVAGAAIAGTYTPVIAEMADEWARFPNLSHGFAIPAIAAYLVWARREGLLAAPMGSALVGLPVLALAVLMLLTGSLGGEAFIARLSLPVALVGASLFLAGAAVTRELWMGIVYLLFMIPLPYVTLKSITYQSRLFDAAVTAEVVQWFGVPVMRDGVMLYLANITLEVADECSSIPAMAALVALGAAYAQMSPRPTWIRVALVLSAVPLGLLSNIVRIVLTALGAYYFGRIVLDNVIHKFNGTTVFLLTVFLLIALDAGLLAVYRRFGRARPTPAGREA